MRIADVRTVLLGHPKTQPPMLRSYALVRIGTDTGLVGWGEASTNYGHAYPTVVKAVVEDVLARSLVGREAGDIAARTAEMRVLLDGYLGWDGLSSQCIGAVETALWDIAGKAAGVPVCALLGGAPRALQLYATGTTMFEASPDWYAHYFDAALKRGITDVKVRLGTDANAAYARVSAVRAHVGPAVTVAIDAYWGYAPEAALRLAERLAPLDIAFFEEPSPQYDLEGLARLTGQSPIRIAVGERVYTPEHYALVARLGAAHIFEPDACISGGLGACLKVVEIARSHGIEVIPHLGSPSAVGLAANLHWAAAAGLPLVEFDVYPDLPARDAILKEPIFALDRVRDGHIAVPSGPGLGIDVDESRLADLPYVAGRTYAEMFPQHETGGRAP